MCLVILLVQHQDQTQSNGHNDAHLPSLTPRSKTLGVICIYRILPPTFHTALDYMNSCSFLHSQALKHKLRQVGTRKVSRLQKESSVKRKKLHEQFCTICTTLININRFNGMVKNLLPLTTCADLNLDKGLDPLRFFKRLCSILCSMSSMTLTALR